MLSFSCKSFGVQLCFCFFLRHQRNGAVIARCSQPEISWWGWRNTEDEYLVTSIAKACQLDPGPRACRTRGDGTDSDSDFGEMPL